MVRVGLLYQTSKPDFKLYQIPIPTLSDTDSAHINTSTFPLGGDPQGSPQFTTNLSLSPMQRNSHGKSERG